MCDIEDYIGGCFATGLLVLFVTACIWGTMALAHSFTSQAHFENQCTAQHGIPDTHTRVWRCTAKDTP